MGRGARAGAEVAAGFGGYYSIATVGPISSGPALAAFDPSGLGAGSGTITPVPAKALVGYPLNATPYTNPDRCHRDTDYRNDFDHWDPRDGVGYWSWTDQMTQGGAWVDTPSVSGLVCCPDLGNGRTWYETSTLHAKRASHAWCVYDPADLAAVAASRVVELPSTSQVRCAVRRVPANPAPYRLRDCQRDCQVGSDREVPVAAPVRTGRRPGWSARSATAPHAGADQGRCR